MEKLNRETQIDRLLNKIKRLEEKQQLGYDISVFLGKEMQSLYDIAKNENLSSEEKISTREKIEMLKCKILNELNHVDYFENEFQSLENELLELMNHKYEC